MQKAKDKGAARIITATLILYAILILYAVHASSCNMETRQEIRKWNSYDPVNR